MATTEPIAPAALDPLTLPLRGSRLVEASAGTGKTWTIAALYLRLVLGHGAGEAGLGRPLDPGQILVMTFTKAATRELSDRIRARLVEAAACFRGERNPHPDDRFLPRLLADHPDGEARTQAAWRLAQAAEAMDDAAVHTIDAWCQRMLREHAFDSGCLFDEELQPNETMMLAEAARDWWRQQVYPLDEEALDDVLALWPSVDRLVEAVRPLLELPLDPAVGEGTLAQCREAAAAGRRAQLAALKAGWAARADQMRDWLEPRWSSKVIPPGRLSTAHGRRWLDLLRTWSVSDETAPPELGKGWERLTRPALEEIAGTRLNDLPEGFDRLERLKADLGALPDARAALRGHAIAGVRARLQQLKAQAGRFGYADMLQRLDDALDEPRRGERARQLRERIVAQYPAALIDEFQDTSPRQLSIFDRVYRIADNEPSRVLLLIGDPKQSIYGFRGADIHSYLKARRATAPRHHVLDTNRRSTRALVAAVNRLFMQAEARPGAGAFGFREHGAANEPTELPFIPVDAAGRAEVLQRGGRPTRTTIDALQFVVAPAPATASDSRDHFAALCAERIVQLLGDAGAGFACADREFERLRPGDIAVLVRTGVEAECVQRALRRRRVASVYLSDKDSVYQRAEAADLLRLLQAVAAPRNVRLARAALATRLLARSLPELLALANDDAAFDEQAEHLRELHAVWQGQGVLAMLRRALHLFELPQRLLASGDDEGERRMTNLLHLAELLQAASMQVDGEPALVRWLAGQIEAARGDRTPAEDQVLRLESDADLVQVVTVHKSKGLEYPLVFLPFATAVAGRPFARPDWVVRRDVDTGARRLELAPDEDDERQQERERLQEDLRLLYVALTRARHALWVGAAMLVERKGSSTLLWPRSALGYLLSGDRAVNPEDAVAALQALAAGGEGIVVTTVDSDTRVPRTPWAGDAPAAELPPPRGYDGRFERSWSISSYTTLVRQAARGATAVLDDLQARTWRDDDDEDEAAGGPPGGAPGVASGGVPGDGAATALVRADRPWHRFPRGAFAGNFLHTQLEWLAGEGFALDSPALQQALHRRCERQGWRHRADDVVAWLQRVVATPLPPLAPPDGAALRALDGRVLPEMEFWLPGDGLDAQQLDRLCREHVAPGLARPALTPRRLHGLLMGFADLVFEHAGRYWVLDYKSNALGGRDADYTDAAMQAAMLQHRYDVQAVLYLLALHRLLQRRLGARYDPARQLGGALYLFLRGIGGPAAGCHLVSPPLALLQALQALLAAPAGEGADV
ncbi:exodeoxyribonuclease V subunit beta [Aquabacterium humicola]|uniref:exodeoxyribonuclease V subunit beta n=1 Tax=Aquabacterium humicola TaxID=3237377 RepID=UPI0025429310|nr:exodeoxyribonuclease V subunit beta [Rubrivivax pictus]